MTELALFDEPEPNFGGPLTVRETNVETARRWTADWHYSHAMPSGGVVSYGGFCPDLIAVVILSYPANEHGLATRYGLQAYPGNMEISRVVVHPAAPKNTASHVIAACFPKWRGRRFTWVFSYADTGQNHHGGIYQALNAVYLGQSPATHGFLLDGQPLHPRVVVHRWGTRSWPTVRDLARNEGLDLLRVEGMNTAKHTYLLPVGHPAERRAIRRVVQPHALPYPKRELVAV